MNGRYISDLRDCSIELNKIKTWINSNPFDSNARYLISYSVIKASGTIERILKSILFDHVSHGANPEAINYFTKHLTEASFNPSPRMIERIIKDFDNSWGDAFKNATNGAFQKGDLKSLVQLRNDFAHGSSITPSIEMVIKYYISGVWILNEVCKIVV